MSFTASRPGNSRLNAAANTKTPASQLPRSTVIAFRPLFPSFPLWTSPLYNTTSITRPRIMILPTQANNICPTPQKLRLCRAFVWAHPASGFNLFRSRAQQLRQTAVGRSTSHSPAPVSCTTPACRTILPYTSRTQGSLNRGARSPPTTPHHRRTVHAQPSMPTTHPIGSSAPGCLARSSPRSAVRRRTVPSWHDDDDDGVEHEVGNTLPAPLRELTNKMARVPLHQTTIMSSPPRSQWTTHPWSSACTHSMREVILCCAANTQARGLRGRGRAHLRTATAVGFGTELSC